jgi:hypothetical protein
VNHRNIPGMQLKGLMCYLLSEPHFGMSVIRVNAFPLAPFTMCILLREITALKFVFTKAAIKSKQVRYFMQQRAMFIF